MTRSCPSWDHDCAEAVVPGGYTCAAHVAEEPLVRRIQLELDRVDEDIRRWEAIEHRHGDEAKAILEPAICWFLDQELIPLGLECKSAFRDVASNRQQLDVIIALEVKSPAFWNAKATVVHNAEHAQLAVHMEITYRRNPGGDLLREARKNLRKLMDSNAQALGQERGLPFTSLVLLGDGALTQSHNIMTSTHDLAHDLDVKREHLDGRPWWPVIDAVVTGRVMYTKHDLLETESAARSPRDRSHRRWPVWAALGTAGGHSLQPLAIARAYLVHRVRLLMDPSLADEGEAWDPRHSAAIVGPIFGAATHEDAGRFYAAGHLSSSRLWHAGHNPTTDEWVPMAVDFGEQPRCGNDKPYLGRVRRARR